MGAVRGSRVLIAVGIPAWLGLLGSGSGRGGVRRRVLLLALAGARLWMGGRCVLARGLGVRRTRVGEEAEECTHDAGEK